MILILQKNGFLSKMVFKKILKYFRSIDCIYPLLLDLMRRLDTLKRAIKKKKSRETRI